MQHFPLLDLPYHVRHEIYKYYLDDLRIYIDRTYSRESETMIPRARLGIPPSFHPSESRVAHLTSTCGQLREEVTPLVFSHVPLTVDYFGLMTNWFAPVPKRHLTNVRKFFLDHSLIQTSKDLGHTIFPHLPRLQVVAWRPNREPALAGLLDETPHSVIWHHEGPEKLSEVLDKQNDYKAMRRVLAAQVEDLYAPWSTFMKGALRSGVAVEVAQDRLSCQWRNSDEPSSNHEHNEAMFAVRYTATPPRKIASSAAGEGTEPLENEVRVDLQVTSNFKQDLERRKQNPKCWIEAWCTSSTCETKVYTGEFPGKQPDL